MRQTSDHAAFGEHDQRGKSFNQSIPVNIIPVCVNVAKGKPATQSSLSQWSTPLGAGGGVSGVMPHNFGFHTSEEERPWWMVDLEYSYRIDRIVLHNRLDGLAERARFCRVEISNDAESWQLIHAGKVNFSGGDRGLPLTLPLSCEETARYVRVSLPETGSLHLAQVEVFADFGDKIRDDFGLPKLYIHGDFMKRAYNPMPYTIKGIDGAGLDQKIIGFHIAHVGYLGNQMIQLIFAIALAKRLGIKYIKVLTGGLINLAAPFWHDGIMFIPDGFEADEPGLYLSGHFFQRHEMAPIIDNLSKQESYDIFKEIIEPRFMQQLPSTDVKYDDELTIHIRSGDIFNGQYATGGYTQPPVAFYTFLIKQLIAEKTIRRVRLVFENFANPSIERVIAFLQDNEIPYRTQNGSLQEDLAALVDSKYLVLGFGSFGIAVCLLSEKIDTVFCFKGTNEDDYAGLPSVQKTVLVRDCEDGYVKIWRWRNTPEDHRLMLHYPESALEITAAHQPDLEPSCRFL